MKWVEFGDLNEFRVSENGDIQSRLEPGGFYKKNVLGVWRDRKPSFKASDYTGAGYLVVSFHGKSFYVHRLVAGAFIPNPLNHKEVDHIDGNRMNNKVENLRWVTHQKNMDNAKERGVLEGRKSFHGKISKEAALEAIKQINAGIMNKFIAKNIGVDPSVISCLRNKRVVFKELHHLVKPPRKYRETA